MKITAAELIKELQDVPGDTVISFQMTDGCCGDYIEMELAFTNIETYDQYRGTPYSVAQIRTEPIKGFTSCIRSGQTKKFIDQWEKDHPVPKK